MAQENKMGIMPIKKLIITMSLPMMISMLVQALYNIVDSIYVARLSEEALTAVTLAFPLQNLMIAFGSGTGVGINAILSKSLGEKRFEQVNRASNTAILLTIFNSLLFVLIGLFMAKHFINSQSSVPYILENGSAYLKIVNCFSFGLFFQMMLERLLQSTGQTFYSMITQVTGAVINIILDPILIFGLLGMPKLGVAGAAYATIIGQITAACIGLYFNITKNKEISLKLKDVFTIDPKMISRVYAIGIPSIIMMSIGSVMTYLFNKILLVFSTTATAVFGVYFKLQSFFFMPVFGMNNGLVPVIAYNYGAKRKDRIIEALKFVLLMAIVIMVIGTIIMQLFPNVLLRMFDASEDMLAIGVPALKIISLHFPLAAVAIVLGSTFQAFGKGMYSLTISIARQLIALIPSAWLLSKTGIINNVWLAFIVAEITSIIISLLFFRKLYKTTIEPL